AGVETVIVERRLQHIVEKARADLPKLKNVIVTGLRDYYPKNFFKLCRILNLKSKAQSSKSRSGIQHPAFSIQPHIWHELLRIGRTPRPVAVKPSDIACLQYTGGTTGTSKGAM